MIRAANAYIDHQAPWALRKTDTARMGSVLNTLVEVIRCVATVLQPFMPGSMATMLEQVGAAPEQRGLADLDAPLPPGLARCRHLRACSRVTSPKAGRALMLVDSHCHLGFV